MTKFYETLRLIIDCKDRNFNKKGFAEKLNVRSDSIGWMKLDLSKDMDKLKEFSELARNIDLRLRGTYEKKAVPSDAEWYRFSPRNDFATSDYSYSELYGNYYYDKVKAYKAPRGCNLVGRFVSQAFVDSYRELGLTGLDFIWEPDNGKYRAPFFYKPIFMERAEKCIYPGVMDYLRKKTYDTITFERMSDKYDFPGADAYWRQADFPEGRLCEVKKYMDNLEVVLSLAVEYDSMPDTDFAYCVLRGFIPIFLVRDAALQKMIHAGTVKADDFEPVLCTDAKEQALLIQKCDVYEEMGIMLENKEHFEKLRLKLAVKERPEFVPSEKEVLCLMRKYKKNHGEYLNRAISKKLSEEVSCSLYSPLLPFYKVACGGRLAEDTYEYFFYEKAKQKNDIWHQKLVENGADTEANHLSEDAVLFGESCDGNYLVLRGGQVFEISCFDLQIVKSWDKVYLFFYENVEG